MRMTRLRARDGSEAEVPLDASKLSFAVLGPRERVAEIDRLAWRVAGEPEPDLGPLSGSDRDAAPTGYLRSASFGIDRGRTTDDVIVDAILGIGC